MKDSTRFCCSSVFVPTTSSLHISENESFLFESYSLPLCVTYMHSFLCKGMFLLLWRYNIAWVVGYHGDLTVQNDFKTISCRGFVCVERVRDCGWRREWKTSRELSFAERPFFFKKIWPSLPLLLNIIKEIFYWLIRRLVIFKSSQLFFSFPLSFSVAFSLVQNFS